tara:strand:+ start:2755 stop:3162 length:408 start_codon:yes stop_codon:yes gene_type:complete
MAELVFDNVFLSLDGTDLSDHVRQVTLTYQAELQDKTAMSDNTRSRLGGLKDWSLSVEFNQDFAASEVDVTIFSLVGTTFTVILRPDAGSVSTTNPNYTGTGILEEYTPIGGSVGDVAIAPITIQAAGDLSRATS